MTEQEIQARQQYVRETVKRGTCNINGSHISRQRLMDILKLPELADASYDRVDETVENFSLESLDEKIRAERVIGEAYVGLSIFKVNAFSEFDFNNKAAILENEAERREKDKVAFHLQYGVGIEPEIDEMERK
ncbi:MAG: hypothetical protein FWE16_02655 [Firmicutes bacterium]|nr:hypothetical protein [Bacillota bacterium]